MQYIQRWRRLGLLMSLIMVLIQVSTSQAGAENMVNPSFGRDGQCTLAGWSYRGLVTTQADTFGNCMASLTASKDLRLSTPVEQLAVLEQSFYLSSLSPLITFGYASNLCGLTLRLYNTSGAVLYQEELTASGTGPSNLTGYARRFTGYGGQHVKISITAHVVSPQAGALTTQKLLIDFHRTNVPQNNDDTPEPDPNGIH